LGEYPLAAYTETAAMNFLCKNASSFGVVHGCMLLLLLLPLLPTRQTLQHQHLA
jgi:hypothetical protein